MPKAKSLAHEDDGGGEFTYTHKPWACMSPLTRTFGPMDDGVFDLRVPARNRCACAQVHDKPHSHACTIKGKRTKVV